MDTTDILDVGSYLQEFLSSVDNLPAEMHYLLTELKNKDLELQELLAKISNRQHKMFVRGSLSNGDYNTTASTEELALRDKIKRDLKRADQLAEEKCALADRAKELLDRHLTRLDQDLESLYPQHNLIPAATISSSRSSSPGTQASPLSKRQAQAAGLTTSSAAAAASGSLTPGSTGPGGPGGAYQTPYNGRGRTPQASLKRPRTTNSNSPGRPPRLPPTGALNTPTASLSASSRTGTGPVVCGANNIKLSDPNTTLEFIQVAVEDALAAAAGNAATHLGPLGVGVVGEEGVHIGEHIEDEERYCYCHNISNGVMIGCDNENCPTEWFHLECVDLEEPPEGTWYCRDCLEGMNKEGASHGQKETQAQQQKGRKKRGRPVGS